LNKGDVEGHEFHGNQYTAGGGGGSAAEDKAHAVLDAIKPKDRNEAIHGKKAPLMWGVGKNEPFKVRFVGPNKDGITSRRTLAFNNLQEWNAWHEDGKVYEIQNIWTKNNDMSPIAPRKGAFKKIEEE
jgi:hypothetical protein